MQHNSTVLHCSIFKVEKMKQNDSKIYLDTLIELADKVLYSVKHEGRNNYKFVPFDELDLYE